jgi:hypothetical protein
MAVNHLNNRTRLWHVPAIAYAELLVLLMHTGQYEDTQGNAVLAIEPPVVHFAGLVPGSISSQRVRLVNRSTRNTRIHVVPPSSSCFKLQHRRPPASLAPGMSEELVIEFCSDQARYHYDSIRIQTPVGAGGRCHGCSSRLCGKVQPHVPDSLPKARCTAWLLSHSSCAHLPYRAYVRPYHTTLQSSSIAKQATSIRTSTNRLGAIMCCPGGQPGAAHSCLPAAQPAHLPKEGGPGQSGTG